VLITLFNCRRQVATLNQKINMKLYVGNLSFQTTEQDLNKLFAQCGTVTETNLIMDRETNRPRGFGFVTMSSAAEGQAAIEAFHGKNHDGRDLTVNEAKPMEARSGGGGGGRRDFGGGGGGRSGGGNRNRY
jgi:cold-inducible RNA-binding protein